MPFTFICTLTFFFTINYIFKHRIFFFYCHWFFKTFNFIFDSYFLFFTSIALAWWVECSPMVRETGVQSRIETYQRLKKWYLITPCLTLSIIRYVSMVKWSNPGKGVVPFPMPRCSSYWKGSLWVALDYRRQLLLFLLYIYLYLNYIFLAFSHFCLTHIFAGLFFSLVFMRHVSFLPSQNNLHNSFIHL